jgi:hypothetical protein
MALKVNTYFGSAAEGKMKAKLSIIIILFSALLNFSCEKRPFDFRNKYLGNYDFVYSYSKWQLNLGVYDTISYTGKVYYDDRDEISLDYNPNLTWVLGIDKDGNLSLPCGVTIGKFENKNNLVLDYTTNTCGGGGLGGGSNYHIVGKKK